MAGEKPTNYFRTRFPVHALAAFFFTIPLSTTAVEITSTTLLGVWLFSGKLLGGTWARSRDLAPVLLFMLLPLLGWFWSPAPEAALAAAANARFWLVTLAVASMGLGALHHRLATGAFLAGLALTCALATAQYAGLYPLAPGTVRYGLFHCYMHGTLSLFLAFSLMLLSRLFREAVGLKTRLTFAALAVFFLFSLFVVIPGRIGYLAFALGLPVMVCNFLGLRFNWKAAAVLALVLLAAALSPTVRHRVSEAMSDVDHYQAGRIDTSLGSRVEMWKFSARLLKEKPLAGGGPGAFETRWKTDKPAGIVANYLNPHNTFCHVAADYGLMGLALLGWVLFAVGRAARAYRGSFRGFLGAGFLLVFLVGSLTNSLITGVTNTVWSAAFAGLLLSSTPLFRVFAPRTPPSLPKDGPEA